MEHQNEFELIKEYKATNNLDLLGELYDPYMPLVYGVCLKYLKDRSMAQDAVMDIFEKLIIELHKHEIPKNFKTWLYVVTKNFCLMKLRHDGSESRAYKKMSVEFMDNEFAAHPIDEEDDIDLSPILKKCMDRLKAEQRTSIELFYYNKLCYKEISDKLEIAEKKVKSDIQNGKRNLKLCIESINNE